MIIYKTVIMEKYLKKIVIEEIEKMIEKKVSFSFRKCNKIDIKEGCPPKC